jgi:hypothetical protein
MNRSNDLKAIVVVAALSSAIHSAPVVADTTSASGWFHGADLKVDEFGRVSVLTEQRLGSKNYVRMAGNSSNCCNGGCTAGGNNC